MSFAPLLWTVRFAAVLGLTSLTLTGEISLPYLVLGWSTWILSYGLDQRPSWEQQLRKLETPAVLGLISVFVLDVWVWHYSIFISIAHFLMLFQSFKLLGLKMRADCLQILIFGFFQILSACTLSADIWHGVILMLWVPTATAGLFWQQVNQEADASGEPFPASARRPYARLAGAMCLGALPLNILLAIGVFLVFPRLSFHNALASWAGDRSGYTDQVNLGQTGSIDSDTAPVLWLSVGTPANRDRWNGYLRGGTLDYFDGHRWTRSTTAGGQTVPSDSNGRFRIRTINPLSHPLRQTVTLLTTEGSTFFAAPQAYEVVAPLSTLQYNFDGSLHWAASWRKPLRYEVLSVDEPLQQRLGMMPTRLDPHAPDYLQLPATSFERTRGLVHSIVKQKSPAAQAHAIETYLRSHYQYSFDQGRTVAENPVEDFLFVRQRGPCGHFASAMAVMLRLQGIRSRIVAGYFRGKWNSRAQQYLIRQSDAHAWVEAYIDGAGWVRFDPSPRQSPADNTTRWVLRAQEYWEFLNYKWIRVIIEYDLYSQVKVLEDVQNTSTRMNGWVAGMLQNSFFHFQSRELARMNSVRAVGAAFLLGAGGLAFLGGILYFLRLLFKRRRAKAATNVLFYKRFLDQMARAGMSKYPSETGHEFAERLLKLPHAPGTAAEITRRYYRTRFASKN